MYKNGKRNINYKIIEEFKVPGFPKFGSKLDDIADVSKLDNVADLGKLDNVADLGKLDNVADLGKAALRTDIDDLTKINKLEDIKGADSISKSLKNGEVPSVNLTRSQKAVTKNEVDSILKDPSIKSTDDLLSKIKNYSLTKKIALGAGIAVISGVAIAAAVASEKINSTDYTITTINNYKAEDEKSKVVTVVYTPNDLFSLQDTVTISESNSDPKIDGTYSLSTVANGMVSINALRIKSPGSSGKLKCTTSFKNQFRDLFKNNVTDPLLGAAGGAIGGALESGGEEAKNLLQTLLETLGLNFDFAGNWWISLIVCIVCCLVLSSLGFAFVMIK